MFYVEVEVEVEVEMQQFPFFNVELRT